MSWQLVFMVSACQLKGWVKMTAFILSEANEIRGDQLVDEILTATGVDLTDKYTFYIPITVEVPDAWVEGHEEEIQAIIDVHVPDPLYFPADLVRLVADQAESDMAAIPSWAAWTEAEAAVWYDANVTDLVDAIPDVDGLTPTAFQNNAQAIVAQMQDIAAAQAAVVRNLARMVIALRNKTWPNLEGSL